MKLKERPTPNLTANALIVLKSRYLLKDERGELAETPQELFQRVAKVIASEEAKNKAQWEEKFFEMMVNLRFIPNSPTLMNAGKKNGQLAACFVLPIEDSLNSIFDTLKYAAKIHQSGGGTGFAFSQLRPEGSPVKTSQGVASGPVSFMRIYDVATETVKQGGTRRGANMAILRVDHPDILKFIECKLDNRSFTNFNISVGITGEFMLATREDRDFWLVDQNGKKFKQVKAKEIFDRIVRSAWQSGDPGLVFLDRMNLFNPTPRAGEFESTNPCAEQPLLPFESCNLGSLNLGTYYLNGNFDWEFFRRDIEIATRFLDNVIDLNSYPIPQCEKITLRNRKIGLGVMGFADLLLMAGLRYSSSGALLLGEHIMSFLDREAKRVSVQLAKSRGAFPNWKGSLWQKLGYSPMRNATVSTVAPTGTISIIAGASSGIEPLFGGVFTRNVLSGQKLKEIHPAVEKLFATRNIEADSLTDELIAQELGEVWSPTRLVPVETHVRMQAAFQRHSDSAVSKTINLPESATLADVAQAYLLAFDLGCKGITVYRDKSKPAQVLDHPADAKSFRAEDCPTC
jgi:ribonucleoside-diphosphate reductase alpha chain